MKDAFTIRLGSGYLTCSPVKAVVQPEDEPQARTPAPKTRLFLPTPAHRRRTGLLKSTCGLATENALFVTLLWDKGQCAGNLPAPAAIGKMRSQFSRKFREAFPQGHGFWKLELDSDRQGVHFHMILTPYAGHPDESQAQDFTAWAQQAWRKIAHSQWDRLVDVRRALPGHPGYLTRADKKASDAALAGYMSECHIHGTIGGKHAPRRHEERYRATREQMTMIREAIMREIREKARYRGGIANQRHLSTVEISDYILHVGVSEMLRQTIVAILTEGSVPVEHVIQTEQTATPASIGAGGTPHLQDEAFSDALEASEVLGVHTDMGSWAECRSGPSGAVLRAFTSYSKGAGSAPVGCQSHMGATHNMTPPRQCAKRLRGP